MAKITHVFKTYFPETNGGLEEAIRQLGNHAQKNGFDVEVVSIAKKRYAIAPGNGIKTTFYKGTFDVFSNPFSMEFARSFKGICENTDILHFHFPWPTAELLAVFHRLKKPALVTFHCDIHKIMPLKRLYLPFVKQYLKKMDKICITSKGLLKTTPYLGQFRDKIEEIPLFLDENRFATLPGPDLQLAEFTKQIKPFAVFAGVLRWYKGLDILLDAAKKIDNDIVIVGKGDLFEKLAARIKTENLKNVHLMGFLSDGNLQFLIQTAKMVVLPSITPAEAFGQILLEGLFFSKPLISTELGTGTSVVNRHNYSGLVVPPADSTSLARAMNHLFTDDALCARYGKNAFQHYCDNFTADVQGDKYLRLYRTFLKA
jgi:O-antigen biosynthesis rhamnosyltransferase